MSGFFPLLRDVTEATLYTVSETDSQGCFAQVHFKGPFEQEDISFGVCL